MSLNNINQQHLGEKLLDHAIASKNYPIMKLLLENKQLDLSSSPSASLERLFTFLEFSNYDSSTAASIEDIIELFLKRSDIKFNINTPNKDDRLPIQKAIFYSKARVATAIINYKSFDPNQRNKQGDTPLFNAINAGEYEITKTLLETNKINLNTNLRHGINISALMASVMSLNPNAKITQLVLSYNQTDINAPLIGGHTALHAAVTFNATEIIQFLLGLRGINVKTTNNKGESPLTTAKQNGAYMLVKLLSEAGSTKPAQFSLKEKLAQWYKK